MTLRPEARQKTIDVLREAFADDEIDVAEFEQRVELVHRAESIGHLRTIVADLRAANLPVPSLEVAPGPTRPRENVAGHSVMGGIIGGGKKAGAWGPARHNWVACVIGGYELDFREVQLGPGVTEVHVFSVIGGTKVLVPPGVRVESSGISIIGGFNHRGWVTSPLPPDAPVIRLTGAAIIGGADIFVLYPGETLGDARRRLKAERKAKRRIAKGK
jgi:hypothetical protein